MALIGTPGVHTTRHPAGASAIHATASALYAVIHEAEGLQPGSTGPGGAQPGASVSACAVFKSLDGGATWTEQDSASRPSFAPQPNGCPGFPVAFDGTLLHILIPVYLATGGSPANDVRLDYYTFDTSTDAWSARIAAGTWVAKTSLASPASTSAPALCALRENGDLVACYLQQTGGLDIVYWRAYSGSWGGQVSSPKTDENQVPAALVRGGSDRIHTAVWRPAADALDMTSFTTSAGAYQEDVIDLASPASASAPGAWPSGAAAYSGGRLLLTFLHGLTASELGVVAITGASADSPTWNVTRLIETGDAATLSPQRGGGLAYGNPACFLLSSSLGYAVWAVDGALAYAKWSGAWSAAALLPSGKIPAIFSPELAELGANLAAVVLDADLGAVGLLGDARAATSQSPYAWYREIAVEGTAGGGGNFAWFGIE